MCMQDIRIGRFARWNTQLFNLGTSVGLTIPANRQRIGLIIDSSIVMSGTQGFLITMTDGTAFTQQYVKSIFEMWLFKHGSIMQQGLTISLLLGNITGSIVEITMPEAFLAAGEKEFLSEMAKSGTPGYGG